MLVYLVFIFCAEHKESNAEKARREFMRIGMLKNTGDIVEPSIQRMSKSDLQSKESTEDENSASPSLINESFYLKEYISMFKSTYNREEKYFYMEDYKIILKEKLFEIFNSTKEKIEFSPQEFIDFLINLREYFLYSASQDFNDKIHRSYDDCIFYKNIGKILKRIVQLHCIKCEEIENDSQLKDLIKRLLSRISDDVNLKTQLSYTDLSGCVGRIDLLILLIDSKLFLKDNKGNLPLTIFDKLAQQNDFEALEKHILNNELNLERKEKEKMITENANLRERIDLKNRETTLLNQEIEKLETLLEQKNIDEEDSIAKIYWLKNQINFLSKRKEEHIEPSNKLKPSSSNIDLLNENVRKMEEELENLREVIFNFEEKQKELKSNQSMMKKDLSVLGEKNKLLNKLSSELAEMNLSSIDELERFTNIIISIDKKEATKKTKSNAPTSNKEEVSEVNPKF